MDKALWHWQLPHCTPRHIESTRHQEAQERTQYGWGSHLSESSSFKTGNQTSRLTLTESRFSKSAPAWSNKCAMTLSRLRIAKCRAGSGPAFISMSVSSRSLKIRYVYNGTIEKNACSCYLTSSTDPSKTANCKGVYSRDSQGLYEDALLTGALILAWANLKS